MMMTDEPLRCMEMDTIYMPGPPIADPLERAARAAYDADWPEPHHAPWEEAAPDIRERYTAIARAVVAAIREPSEGMEEAGGDETIPVGWENVEIGRYGAEIAWKAMIDTLLEAGK